MKGEHFKMKNHGLRRVFSLLLALFMVFTLLPTAALAEDVAEPQAVVEENSAIQYAFVLKFDANGGVGAFGDVTQVSDMQPYDQFKMIQIPADYIPTREGYTFKGWKDTNGYGAVYQPGVNVNVNRTNSGCVVTDSSCTMTLYAVWEQPAVPDQKEYTFTLNYDDNGGTGAPETQTYTESSAEDSLAHAFTVSDVAPTRDGYTFRGWSTAANGAAEYQPNDYYTLTATSGSINVSMTLYAVWQQNGAEETYTVTYRDGRGGNWFQDEVHSGLKSGDATPAYNNNVAPTRKGYTFLGWTPKVAETVTENATYTAQWESKAECAVKDLLKNITVECVSGVEGHDARTYNTSVGGYTAVTVENEEGNFISTITVEAQKYVEQYNKDTGATHVLASGESSSRTIKVVFDSSYEKYEVSEGSLPVTFQVVCKDEVVPPTEPTLDELRNLLGQVTVDCTNANANHPDKEYDLIKGSYTANGAVHSDAYICAIGVIADKYVKAYNKDYPGHKLAGSTNFDKVKMVYLTRVTTGTGYTWRVISIPAEPDVLTFNVVCEDVPAETFTVTYTDGVKNKVIFKDDVHENLAYGTATPKFTGGTPKRTGYTFTGWKPKVADTVTGNVTYVAQWKSNSGKDNVPKTGDGEIVMTLSSVLLLSFCGAAAVCVFDRKRKHF